MSGAARFFESLETDEIAGALAGHYFAAHANAADGPEAKALAGQARIALRAAAERASTLGSIGQAQRFYEQALYKHGWSLFKQSLTEESLPSFGGVLESKLMGPRNTPVRIEDLDDVQDVFHNADIQA